MDSSADREDSEPRLCSDCFFDEGLRLDAGRIGRESNTVCPQCGSISGRKLDARTLNVLAHRFFVTGSLFRTEYGGAPVIQFNDKRISDINEDRSHSRDAKLIASATGIGFFYYGPRLWMLGHIEPLEALQIEESRSQVVDRILNEYPRVSWGTDRKIYRLRKDVECPTEPSQFDSPPDAFCGGGRLDSSTGPVLYGSPDLEVCVHECRATADDDLHFATLIPTAPLELLDLTSVIKEDVSEFESLDLAVHLLFQARAHSYPITRDLAYRARVAGLAGIVFPSYFSLLRTGAPFLETVIGMSTRKFAGREAYEQAKMVPNVALFGRPIAEGLVEVRGINRLYIRQAVYDLGFGPVKP